MIISTTLKDIVVILHNSKNEIYKKFITGKNSGNYLPKAIQEILIESEVSLNGIENFCIDIGPGSFTGIRIAISTLQGILINFPKKEVYTFFSSDVVNLSAQKKYANYLKNKKTAVLKRARENAAYISIYRGIRRIFGPQMVFEQKFEELLNNCILLNEESSYFKEKNCLKNDILYTNIDEQAIIKVALGNGKVKIKNLSPLYLQKPIAVENYEKNKL
ncbi:tRNA (adenosine(37)-N6)-threonylcarbamoyltransferase complex dimerization subunit type 1 TsaB [Petrotoga sp. 9PWA.NaAc.5.4]|uniref:tRNA (adenosine(37)-N6)-threonylcarbamoyltransferase complex dimerization subunit type 1 TsaB n=1 Tax=Petrotoga sp. 9PWA.NaAc.5.4 TaxID=1434328 RepID=UPI000CAFE68F|nr:tRNA (adenosine(37)-N6)-threonylcarbamoyltransferase complex dimerization subunit type 1 TsaB [Petrotoga sp. 9PWA.NaAc.5.4]PNR96866.1 hypothetical protein X924_02790 [Petrotoga sp. 9PWA.NaAc.5.4]